MGKIAFLFPGQGAQYVGMGKSLYDAYPAARDVYEMCEVPNKELDIVWNGTKENLMETKTAQPALFLADLAAACALDDELQKRGILVRQETEPGFERMCTLEDVSPVSGAAGFSLGEMPALVFAGVMPIMTGYLLVQSRAGFMDECAKKHKGGMMAILGLTAEQIENACAEVGNAWPVNYNTPGQIVVAYEIEAEAALKEAIVAAKGKALPLAVSGAFHSPLMNEAAEKFAAEIASNPFEWSATEFPLYSNVTAQPYGADVKNLLAKQINSPVRWQATIENMIADGFDTFIETGPGKTLTGMVKKIDKNVRTFNVYDAETLEGCVNGIIDRSVKGLMLDVQ